MDKYCNKCGRLLELTKLPEFDTQTGKPLEKLVCPTGMCTHYGIGDHKVDWDRFFPRCLRCGTRIRVE